MGVFASYSSGLASADQLENFDLDEGSVVISADDVELATFAAEQRRVLPYDRIPQVVIDATVSAEDQTFWVNPCIDFRGIVRATIDNLTRQDIVSGASTICQQLVRMRLIEPELTASADRRFERKIMEAILALRVGERYRGQDGKERLMEMYLNQVYYGNNAYGIWAAAMAYFGKDISIPTDPEYQGEDQADVREANELTLAEAALLAGLIRSPSDLDPTRVAVEDENEDGETVLVVPPEAEAIRVRGFVLDKMLEQGYITADERAAVDEEPVVLAAQEEREYLAPHFVFAVRREAAELLGSEDRLDRDGLTITTTLDYEGYQESAEKWARVAYDMSRLSEEELREEYGDEALGWITTLQGRNINNDAIVTLNYRTGAVLAYVGSANFAGEATPEHQPEYDAAGQAFRQSGSAFKPITYLTGFERGAFTPATMFMDVEGIIADDYTVPNADRRERGPVRIRDALKYSLNIPAVKAQQIAGTDAVVEMGERLGLEWDPAHESVNVPSLTLGTIGVHQLDLAGAYAAIANGGVFAEPYLIERIEDSEGNLIYERSEDGPEPARVVSEAAAYLVTDILADNTDPEANALWGPRFALRTEDGGRRPATLKTGTTNDFRDLQAFGYLAADPESDEGAIMTGVWVGNSDFSAIEDVFAADVATYIWHDYMTEVAALNELPVVDFARPASVVEVEVDAMSGLLPGDETLTTVTELFAEDRQPAREDDTHRRLRIEAETGKIWQPGCGDYLETAAPDGEEPDDDDPPPADERVYLDLTEWEEDRETWHEANMDWLEEVRGPDGEAEVDRTPLGPLDAPLAPLEECTPG